MQKNLKCDKLMFDKVKQMRSEISILFNGLDGRLNKLNNIYKEYVNYTKVIKTNDIKTFIFKSFN